VHNIMDQAMAAFSGKDALEAIIIAVICALLAGRIVLVVVLAVVAVAVDTFLPIVYNIVQAGNTDGVAAVSTDIINQAQANPMLLAIKYVVYLIVIGILFLVKSTVFRR